MKKDLTFTEARASLSQILQEITWTQQQGLLQSDACLSVPSQQGNCKLPNTTLMMARAPGPLEQTPYRFSWQWLQLTLHCCHLGILQFTLKRLHGVQSRINFHRATGFVSLQQREAWVT